MNVSRAVVRIILQVLLFIIVHDGTLKLYEQFGDASKTNLDWGLSITVAIWLFAVISISITLLGESVYRHRQITVLSIGFFIFTAFCIQYFTYRPYRTILLLVSAFIGLIVPFLISRKGIKNADF